LFFDKYLLWCIEVKNPLVSVSPATGMDIQQEFTTVPPIQSMCDTEMATTTQSVIPMAMVKEHMTTTMTAEDQVVTIMEVEQTGTMTMAGHTGTMTTVVHMETMTEADQMGMMPAVD